MKYFKICRLNFASMQILFICLSVLFLSSCDSCNKKLEVNESLLTGYNLIAHSQVVSNATEDIDCYLDYSFGMGEGMKATAQFNLKLQDFLRGYQVNYYKVGKSDTLPTINLDSKEASFTEMNNFKEPGSKLKVAIDKITSNKTKSSLFITDFEKVDNVNLKQDLIGAPEPHPIDITAWAQNNFKEWLNEGNQIDIFAKQYSKPDYWFDKSNKLYLNWIYTIVFTPNAVLKDDKLYKRSVLKFLNDEYTNLNGSDSKHFSYNANNFKIEQGKKEDAIGNANDNIVVQENISTTKDKGFEYYNFKSSDLISFISDESQKDKRIINKVKIISEMSCFSNIQYGLNVYDVTQSLTDFSQSLNQKTPEVATDPETGKKDTVANKTIVYKYEEGIPINDLFEFVYNDDIKEIGIKLKQEFTGVDQNTIYQIDVVIKAVKLKDFKDEEEILKLNYSKDYKIKSLSESIKLSMTSVANTMENNVLYTFYIKIDK